MFFVWLLSKTSYSVKCFKLLPLYWLPSSVEFQQNKANLVEQIKNLKADYVKRSKLCDYIIKSSVEGM